MSKKYNCRTCNYSTDRHYDFLKHKTTKKHINLQKSIPIVENATMVVENATMVVKKATMKVVMCEYCQTKISKKKYLKRHYISCKKYGEYMIKKKKDFIIQQLIDETKRQAELLEQNKQNIKKKDEKLKKKQEELEELRDMEKEYLDFMKKVANTGTSVTNINNVNMYYIIQHYIKAKNYEDIMDTPLTKNEEKCVLENGGVYGGYSILVKRCIDGLSLEERPFHCVDGARSKYMLRTNNTWQIDKKGEQVLAEIYPKMLKLCAPDPNISSTSELDNWKKHNDYMVELSNGGEGKILKMLNEVSLLKNNVVLDK